MHQLSPTYNKLYKQNILQFQKKYHNTYEEDADYTDFYPSIGNPNAEILVYGQAVNGWGSGFNTKAQITEDKIKESIDFSNTGLPEKGLNCLDWVNVCWSNSLYNDYTVDEKIKDFYKNVTYRTCRSFFWNVVYKLVCKYHNIDIHSREWAEHVVWSNLYKIAPDKANPNNEEQSFQLPLSVQLVRQEIEEINPKLCVVLTNGSWWKPFHDHLKTERLSFDDLPPEIVSIEQYRNTKIIVTKRPPFGNSDKYVGHILNYISY